MAKSSTLRGFCPVVDSGSLLKSRAQVGTFQMICYTTPGNWKPIQAEDVELTSLVIGAEELLKSKPPEPVSEDPSDSEDLILTPSRPSCRMRQPGGSFAPKVADQAQARPRTCWKYLQVLTAEFWQLWLLNLIVKLLAQHKWREKPVVKSR